VAELVLPPNVTLVSKGFPAGAAECAHDWRVNPVVCATTDGPEWGRERELWLCVNCKVQVAGPPLGRYPDPRGGQPVAPFDPTTWVRRQGADFVTRDVAAGTTLYDPRATAPDA
jgi:hypothetical protein